MAGLTYSKYYLLSFLGGVAVVYHAFATRQHFYPAMVYLSTSKLAVALLGNMVFASALLCQSIAIKVFLGGLREIEVEMVRERLSSAIMESLLALTVFRDEFGTFFVAMFATLAFVKVLHWLIQDRVDYIEVSPSVTALQHLRISSFLLLLLGVDALLVQYTIDSSIKSSGQSVMVLFAFEYVILTSDVCRHGLKYLMSMVDLMMDGGWESKGIYVFYLQLITDVLHLFVYVIFFIIVFTNYGLPLHLIRDLYATFRNFRNRLADFLRFRQVTARLDQLPDATPEDLARSDGVCIICREEMSANGSNKRLHCGHLFHVQCLRSWLERQQNCPTCRAPVFRPPPHRAATGGVLADMQPHAAAAPQQQQQQPEEAGGVVPGLRARAVFTFGPRGRVHGDAGRAAPQDHVQAPPAAEARADGSAREQEQGQQQHSRLLGGFLSRRLGSVAARGGRGGRGGGVSGRGGRRQAGSAVAAAAASAGGPGAGVGVRMGTGGQPAVLPLHALPHLPLPPPPPYAPPPFGAPYWPSSFIPAAPMAGMHPMAAMLGGGLPGSYSPPAMPPPGPEGAALGAQQNPAAFLQQPLAHPGMMPPYMMPPPVMMPPMFPIVLPPLTPTPSPHSLIEQQAQAAAAAAALAAAAAVGAYNPQAGLFVSVPNAHGVLGPLQPPQHPSTAPVASSGSAPSGAQEQGLQQQDGSEQTKRQEEQQQQQQDQEPEQENLQRVEQNRGHQDEEGGPSTATST